MSRRYYPCTRERITRALNEGAKYWAHSNPYSRRNSGQLLHRAFARGHDLAWGNRAGEIPGPVVDLSAELQDVMREVGPVLAARLSGSAHGT